MNNGDQNMNLQPANSPRSERLPVCFGADFPVEFTIRRLEDVPLRLVLEEPKRSRAVRQKT